MAANGTEARIKALEQCVFDKEMPGRLTTVEVEVSNMKTDQHDLKERVGRTEISVAKIMTFGVVIQTLIVVGLALWKAIGS